MSHNPHPFHIRGSRVGILEEHRRTVGGEFATVMDYFWREDSPWLILQLPDGKRVVTPLTWTDLPADTFPPTTQRPLLLARALPPMAQSYQRLRTTRSTKRRSPG
jgi:hypothetical protein